MPTGQHRLGSSRGGGAARAGSPFRLELSGVAILLAATSVLYTSQGLTHTLVPLRLGSGHAAGWVTAAYFVGFVAGAFHGARSVRRVGHIRAFGALTGLIVIAVLVLPLSPIAAWIVVRLVHGASVAALATVVEAWLTAVASARTRGRVLGVYTAVSYAGFGVGPLLLAPFPHSGWEAFSVGAILVCVAGVPVLLWRVDAPPVPIAPPAGVRGLLAVAPLGLVVAGGAGMAGGAFTALGPLFATSLGLESGGVGLLMSVTLLGGAALQWGVGYASDRFDRSGVMVAGSSAAGLLGLFLGFASGLPIGLAVTLLVVFEGVQLSLYPMALALANDRTPEGLDTTDLASALLLAYGLGAVAGPAFAGVVSLWLGPGAAFLLAGVVLLATALYGVAWRRRATRVPLELQGSYAALPHSTPEVFELDPETVPEADFIDHVEAAEGTLEGDGPGP